jgi:Flp pilus assembly protein TadG
VSAFDPDLRRDRGAAEALGLVVLAPFVIGLALVVVWLGRSVNVDAQLRTAAEAAAQAGALERNDADAERAAQRVVDAMLVDSQECSAAEAVLPPVGTPGIGIGAGLIEVRVVCTVDRGALPARADERTATAWATVDRFRAEGGP